MPLFTCKLVERAAGAMPLFTCQLVKRAAGAMALLPLLRELLGIVRLGAQPQEVEQHHPRLQVHRRLQPVEVDVDEPLHLTSPHATTY